MITENDLQEAIHKCLGESSPNANTCIKLAAYYTIQHELFGKIGNPDLSPITPEQSYSFVPGPAGEIIYDSGSEFSRAIDGRAQEEVWPIMDELMQAVEGLLPRLYDATMRKLQA